MLGMGLSVGTAIGTAVSSVKDPQHHFAPLAHLLGLRLGFAWCEKGTSVHMLAIYTYILVRPRPPCNTVPSRSAIPLPLKTARRSESACRVIPSSSHSHTERHFRRKPIVREEPLPHPRTISSLAIFRIRVFYSCRSGGDWARTRSPTQHSLSTHVVLTHHASLDAMPRPR